MGVLESARSLRVSCSLRRERVTPAAGHVESAREVEAVREAVQEAAAGDRALETFLTDGCISRYLVANGGCVRKAAKGLTQTLQWRAAQRPGCIKWRDVQHCSSGGRLELLPDVDLQGRPVLLHRLRCPSPPLTDDEHIMAWVHVLEAACHMADTGKGAGTILAIFDMAGYGDPDTVKAGFMTQLEAVRIAQRHYPERLGLAVVTNPPLLFWALWRAAQPFLDAVTRKKIVFVCGDAIRATLQPHIEPGRLYHTLGGDKPEDFQFTEYSERMSRLDTERDPCV